MIVDMAGYGVGRKGKEREEHKKQAEPACIVSLSPFPDLCRNHGESQKERDPEAGAEESYNADRGAEPRAAASVASSEKYAERLVKKLIEHAFMIKIEGAAAGKGKECNPAYCGKSGCPPESPGRNETEHHCEELRPEECPVVEPH